MRHVLSMGHRITELSVSFNDFDGRDEICVTKYVARYATTTPDTSSQSVPNAAALTQVYNYNVFNRAQERFVPNRQKFSKYREEYPFNALDVMICGEQESMIAQKLRYRRVFFAVLPQNNDADQGEGVIAEKFGRLLEYLSNRTGESLKVNIVEGDSGSAGMRRDATSRRSQSVVLQFSNDKKKSGTTDRYEWALMQLGTTFNPRRVFRISFHWLVATSPRIETEVKTLQRRCAQFGLTLHQFPETSISPNLLLHAFLAPPSIIVPSGGEWITSKLLLNPSLGFVDDGWRMTDYDIPGLPGFSFVARGRYSPRQAQARQLIHESGGYFVRVLADKNGKAAFFYCSNKEKSNTKIEVGYRDFKELIQKYERDWNDRKQDDGNEMGLG